MFCDFNVFVIVYCVCTVYKQYFYAEPMQFVASVFLSLLLISAKPECHK